MPLFFTQDEHRMIMDQFSKFLESGTEKEMKIAVRFIPPNAWLKTFSNGDNLLSLLIKGKRSTHFKIAVNRIASEKIEVPPSSGIKISPIHFILSKQVYPLFYDQESGADHLQFILEYGRISQSAITEDNINLLLKTLLIPLSVDENERLYMQIPLIDWKHRAKSGHSFLQYLIIFQAENILQASLVYLCTHKSYELIDQLISEQIYPAISGDLGYKNRETFMAVLAREPSLNPLAIKISKFHWEKRIHNLLSTTSFEQLKAAIEAFSFEEWQAPSSFDGEVNLLTCIATRKDSLFLKNTINLLQKRFGAAATPLIINRLFPVINAYPYVVDVLVSTNIINQDSFTQKLIEQTSALTTLKNYQLKLTNWFYRTSSGNTFLQHLVANNYQILLARSLYYLSRYNPTDPKNSILINELRMQLQPLLNYSSTNIFRDNMLNAIDQIAMLFDESRIGEAETTNVINWLDAAHIMEKDKITAELQKRHEPSMTALLAGLFSPTILSSTANVASVSVTGKRKVVPPSEDATAPPAPKRSRLFSNDTSSSSAAVESLATLGAISSHLRVYN